MNQNNNQQKQEKQKGLVKSHSMKSINSDKQIAPCFDKLQIPNSTRESQKNQFDFAPTSLRKLPLNDKQMKGETNLLNKDNSNNNPSLQNQQNLRFPFPPQNQQFLKTIQGKTEVFQQKIQNLPIKIQEQGKKQEQGSQLKREQNQNQQITSLEEQQQQIKQFPGQTLEQIQEQSYLEQNNQKDSSSMQLQYVNQKLILQQKKEQNLIQQITKISKIQFLNAKQNQVFQQIKEQSQTQQLQSQEEQKKQITSQPKQLFGIFQKQNQTIESQLPQFDKKIQNVIYHQHQLQNYEIIPSKQIDNSQAKKEKIRIISSNIPIVSNQQTNIKSNCKNYFLPSLRQPSQQLNDSGETLLTSRYQQCIRCELKSPEEIINLSCKHFFHLSCLQEHLQFQSQDQNQFKFECICKMEIPQKLVRVHFDILAEKLFIKQVKKIKESIQDKIIKCLNKSCNFFIIKKNRNEFIFYCPQCNINQQKQ